MGRFHRAILVTGSAVVAGRAHPVVGAQPVVAFGQILLLVGAQVLVGRQQTVGAMFPRGPAEAPQRFLQPLGQRRVGLPAEHHLHVAPAAEGQAEVVQAVHQRLAVDGDRHVLQLGEIRQPQAPQLLALTEHHFLVRPVQRLPRLHPPLEGALAGIRIGPQVEFLQVLEQRRGAERRLALQKRHHLAVPDLGKWVFARAPVALLRCLGRQLPGLDAPSGALR